MSGGLRIPRLLVAFGGLHFVLFPIPIITLFWKDQIGLSLTEIMSLQAIFSLASVVLEFPSGYVADRIGHRTSILAGATLWTIGWSLYAAGETFGDMMVAEVVLGAGHAFVSGADAALLFSSLAAAGQIGTYTRWEGRTRAAGQACEAVSSAMGGWLYALAPRFPFWLQVPVALASVGTAVAMTEPPRAATGVAVAHGARMWLVVRHAFRHRRLRSAIGLSVVLGLSTFVMVWLIQPWMQGRGIPVAWFGPIWAAAHVYLAGVSLMSARIGEAFGIRTTLAACAILVVLGYTALALFESAWAVLFYLLFMTTRGLQAPLLATVVQADAPDEDRAGLLSLNALCFRLAFVISGPLVGAMVDRVGLDAALGVLAIATGVLSAVALSTFGAAHRRHLPG